MDEAGYWKLFLSIWPSLALFVGVNISATVTLHGIIQFWRVKELTNDNVADIAGAISFFQLHVHVHRVADSHVVRYGVTRIMIPNAIFNIVILPNSLHFSFLVE